jgi:protein-disulfide isomerase
MSDAQLRPAVGDGDHAQGAPQAAVTLVEYGDFECPHCAHAHPIVQEVQRRLGDRLRFVFRHFPLTEIHPHALHAAEAAASVAAQRGEPGFWAMHDTIFEHQQDSRTALSDRHLAGYAAGAGADGTAVERDLASDAYEDRVQSDFMSGVRSGVNGTPTFFINGARFEGNWADADTFAAALERAAVRH